MKTLGFVSSLAVFLAGSLAICLKSAGFFSGLYFVPFSLGPLLVSLMFASALQGRRKSQIVLLVGSLLYGVWFSIAYLEIFYWHLDPQSVIGLLFVGVYALPVMAVVWSVSAIVGRSAPAGIQEIGSKKL